jgi:hypothetical protein
MENIKTYEMLIEDENTDNVFAISIVNSPAIEQNFIMLNKNITRIEINLEKADTKRRVLTGPALIPNIIIPRDGFNITFSNDTVRKLSENFIIKNNKDNVTLQHQMKVDGIFLIESWIVEDENNDKIYALGYTKKQIPKGTWCVSYKINNDDIWNEYLKNGIFKGFSIESELSRKELKLSELDEEDKLVKEIFLALYYTEADLDTKYKWKLGPETEDRKNCPVCKIHANKIYTLREWLKIAIPATPDNYMLSQNVTTNYEKEECKGKYGTFCEQHCNCQLVKVAKVTRQGATIISPF